MVTQLDGFSDCTRVNANHEIIVLLRETANKSYFLSGRTRPLRKKKFVEARKKSEKNLSTKLEGRGGRALEVGPLKNFFLQLPLELLSM